MITTTGAGRDLRVNHQSVANWVKEAATAATRAAAEPLPQPPVADTVVELDELFTFVGNKKSNVRCHPSSPANTLFHELASRYESERCNASAYCRPSADCLSVLHRWLDGLRRDDALNYHTGLHLVAHGKSQTYSVEGGNADLMHYLARLAKKSRCFSRCIQVLKRNIALFVQCWNRHQLFKRTYPSYNPPLRNFACVWV